MMLLLLPVISKEDTMIGLVTLLKSTIQNKPPVERPPPTTNAILSVLESARPVYTTYKCQNCMKNGWRMKSRALQVFPGKVTRDNRTGALMLEILKIPSPPC